MKDTIPLSEATQLRAQDLICHEANSTPHACRPPRALAVNAMCLPVCACVCVCVCVCVCRDPAIADLRLTANCRQGIEASSYPMQRRYVQCTAWHMGAGPCFQRWCGCTRGGGHYCHASTAYLCSFHIHPCTGAGMHKSVGLACALDKPSNSVCHTVLLAGGSQRPALHAGVANVPRRPLVSSTVAPERPST